MDPLAWDAMATALVIAVAEEAFFVQDFLVDDCWAAALEMGVAEATFLVQDFLVELDGDETIEEDAWTCATAEEVTTEETIADEEGIAAWVETASIDVALEANELEASTTELEDAIETTELEATEEESTDEVAEEELETTAPPGPATLVVSDPLSMYTPEK